MPWRCAVGVDDDDVEVGICSVADVVQIRAGHHHPEPVVAVDRLPEALAEQPDLADYGEPQPAALLCGIGAALSAQANRLRPQRTSSRWSSRASISSRRPTGLRLLFR
jgi:hypothetical protein